MDVSMLILEDQRGEVNYPNPVQGRVCHIDADLTAYQVSAETKDELSGIKPRKRLEDMKYNAERSLIHLMRITGSTSYVAHITPPASNKGGRYEIALTKEYQGNRKDKESPEHLGTIRAYIGEELPSVISLDCEADDSLCMAAYNAPDRNLCVIVSRDKDLRMVDGLHWCYDEEMVIDADGFGSIWVDRTKKTAKLKGWGTSWFWAQLLMGDTADNIAGLPIALIKDKQKKVGPILAYTLLEDCKTDRECFDTCKELFKTSPYEWHDYRDGSETTWGAHMLADMKLLWMRRRPSQNDVTEWLGEME